MLVSFEIYNIKIIYKVIPLIPLFVFSLSLTPTNSFIADKGIGKIPESDREIDIVFGAYQMQFWDIKLDPRAEKLDVSGLKNREFISF